MTGESGRRQASGRPLIHSSLHYCPLTGLRFPETSHFDALDRASTSREVVTQGADGARRCRSALRSVVRRSSFCRVVRYPPVMHPIAD